MALDSWRREATLQNLPASHNMIPSSTVQGTNPTEFTFLGCCREKNKINQEDAPNGRLLGPALRLIMQDPVSKTVVITCLGISSWHAPTELCKEAALRGWLLGSAGVRSVLLSVKNATWEFLSLCSTAAIQGKISLYVFLKITIRFLIFWQRTDSSAKAVPLG